MRPLTAANQLTLLRMVLIPPFAILLLYGFRGWALATFVAAGITDLSPYTAGDGSSDLALDLFVADWGEGG